MINTITNNYISLKRSLYNGKKHQINTRKSISTILGADTLEVHNDKLSFYNLNKSSAQVLLDAINFYEGCVSAVTSGEKYFTFGNGGQGQVIPFGALSLMNTKSFQPLYAVNNNINLSSKSYYSYQAIDGNSYTCAFNGKTISRAFTESIIGNDKDNVSAECRGSTVTTMSVLSTLISGKADFHMFRRESVKASLKNLGIEPGEFSITVDGKAKTFYLGENGKVFTQESALSIVTMYNTNTWLNSKQVGDKITVFGNDYKIDETGHIKVPTEGFWKNETCSLNK
ncbi:MAG: hypothetical protein H2184_05105 [Candidatus Galacturonibacter soehngenii]|nr:hypothetical protein [Candidatus Galacturonibacter soehngenii]